MACNTAFDALCTGLESETSLNQLEARGTVRIALKEAGLDAKTASAEQLRVVIAKLLPSELEARGVENVAAVCDSLCRAVDDCPAAGDAADSPEAVFARLGG
jgi:hypothetical protein